MFKKTIMSLALASVSTFAIADIGSINKISGTNIVIDRNKNEIKGNLKTNIKSMDLVKVGTNSEANISFKDNTKVRITANSRLVIDDFVYDSKKSDAGKLALRVTLGTVRYASGQIAKRNRQMVNLQTPTATIAVRGTDFSMTVDESGRSAIVLLPSCDDEKKLLAYADNKSDCKVGEIEVMTQMGSVILNQPFTATAVVVPGDSPIKPVKIDPNIRTINNTLILKVPAALQAAIKDVEKKKQRKKSAMSETSEDESFISRNSDSKISIAQVTNIIPIGKEKLTESEVVPIGPCSVFNRCWNEKGANNYIKMVDQSKSTIYIAFDERYDNTTYTIYQNSMDPEIKITGDGLKNRVTIRQFDR